MDQTISPKAKGFSLIELIVIILILAILAVVAAPRFLDLSADSKASTVNALAGSIKTAVNIQHGLARLNQDKGGLNNGFVSDDGILFDQGYPVALDFDVPFGSFSSGNDGTPEILEALELDLNSWTFNTRINGTENGEITRELYITSRDVIADGASVAQIIATNCYTSYDSFLSVPQPPVVKVITTDC